MRKGKQRVRDNDISPTAPSKRRHRSSSSKPSTTCHATSPPRGFSLSPHSSATEVASRAMPIRSSSSSSSSTPSMQSPPTPWVPCHITAVPGSRLVEVGSLLPKSKDKVTMALTLLGATNAQDVRKHSLKLSVQLHPDKSKDSGATDRFQLLLKAYNLLKDKYRLHWKAPDVLRPKRSDSSNGNRFELRSRWCRQQYSHLQLLAKGQRVIHILDFLGSRSTDPGIVQDALCGRRTKR